MLANNAINADGLGQRAFGASPNTAGYGERYASVNSLQNIEIKMVKISILYPNQGDARFDFDYYTQRHMPRSIELLSAHPDFRGVSVERGLGGTEPNMPASYLAMCHFSFVSVDSFLEAFMPHAEELQGDMPNYTNIAPLIQFNEVLI